jgi:hypothetical protein
MTYDPRLMSFKGLHTVSLLTLDGRALVPLIYGEYPRERFDRMKGQCDLVERDGQFYLYASISIPDGAPIEPTDFLGVDLGIVNLATDSDGRCTPARPASRGAGASRDGHDFARCDRRPDGPGSVSHRQADLHRRPPSLLRTIALCLGPLDDRRHLST